jgi:hypothetical protein
MRRYRPFLIYNPKYGWAFYLNHATSPLTYKNIGTHRKEMRKRVGWFLDPSMAIMFEKAERRL